MHCICPEHAGKQNYAARLRNFLCFTDNLAIFQSASQESTASKGSTKQWPINAVDSSPHGTCSQTNPWKQTWWTVDLGQNRYVAGTIITVPFSPGKFGIYVFIGFGSCFRCPLSYLCHLRQPRVLTPLRAQSSR